MNTELSGGCQCGEVRYQLIAAPRMLYACHCRDCQKQSASAFGLSLILSRRQVKFTQGEQSLKTWDTRGGDGKLKRCYFCPNCGSRIMHGGDDAETTVSIKAGSLDDTRDLQPVAHIWMRSAQSWLSQPPGAAVCFAQEPDDEQELARLWQGQNPVP